MEKNRIYLGDAYELIKQVPTKSVDLIVTDPPYVLKGWHTASGIMKDRKFNGYVNSMLREDENLLKGITARQREAGIEQLKLF